LASTFWTTVNKGLAGDINQFRRLLTSDFWDAVMLFIAGVCLALIGYICGKVRGGVRDRVLAILVLGVFVMFFWGAFEQAGNVLNLWADKNTNRYLWEPMKRLPEVPDVHEDAPKAGGEEAEPEKPGLLMRFVTMFRLKPARDDVK